MEKYRPKIILNAAVSIDGKLATMTGESKLSSKEDLTRLHKLRSKVDAIIVGKNTVLKDNPLLTVRFSKGKNPIRIILDSNGVIPKNSKILQTSSKIPTIIAVRKKIPKHNIKKLQKFPVEIIYAGNTSVKLTTLLKQLLKKNIDSILVEGGGNVHGQFIKSQLFDELFLTITPKIIGGSDSTSFVEGWGIKKISKSPKLHLKSSHRLKNDMVLHYVKM
ncbi:MAG: 2,5-diamino-6-(ribosylamino)-4(3H)-pyrimidinone 5'-phosphate reductase [Nitrosopumilaceae archaeon]|nr:2,5-diamino-6-(ribosylamino)-4(3H)-pyrimidinone 5'-phosphate reductase [Nitrosopumilaceae archaeon]